MPLPDWLKNDEGDKPQPQAAAPQPQEEPEDEVEVEVEDEDEAEVEAEFDVEIEAPDAEIEPDVEPCAEPEAEPEAEPVAVDDDPLALPPTGNDQVISMLAQIERQLRDLGEVQRAHEEQLSSLADGEAAEDDPVPAVGRQKQPSFVVEMDENDAQVPAPQELGELATEIGSMREILEQKTEDLEESERKARSLQSRVLEFEAVAAVSDGTETDSSDTTELNEQIDELQRELRDRDSAISELHEKIEASSSVRAPAAAPPDGAGQEMLERQRRQIERLTEQLSSMGGDADPLEIQKRDDRIAELEEEIERAGGSGRGMGKLVAGFGDALSKVRGKKDGSGEGQEITELEERLTEMELQCTRYQEQAEQATNDAEQARQMLQSKAQDPEFSMPAGTAADEPAAALRQRVEDLQQELAETRATKPASGPTLDHGELRSKIEVEMREKWSELSQRQTALDEAEATMLKKWARPQTTVVFACLLGSMLMVAAVSWFAAGRVAPPVISASVNVEAKSRSGVPVSEADANDWNVVHTAMLQDDNFRNFVAKRLADRRLDRYTDPDELASRLADDFTIDSPRPDTLTLTLSGTDRDEITTVLDTIATSLGLRSARQSGKRSDGAIATVRGEREVKGRARYATLNPTIIEDRRKVLASIFCIMGMVISVVVMKKIYRWLLRTRGQGGGEEIEYTADML